MKGYDDSSYGEAFADVYDEWYGDVSDVESTVSALARLSDEIGDFPIVELGVGTGRLAIPLAQLVAPRSVLGIDSSAAMLRQLALKPGSELVQTVLGDMINDLPAGPMGVVFAAFNTFFNLGSEERQRRCMGVVAQRLAPAGLLVIEALVPERPPRSGSHVEVKSIDSDRVVLSVSRYDGTEQTAEGQFIEFTETGGVRLRPWSIRHVSPAELDSMAATAGMALHNRWETFAGAAFTDDSTRHVSVYSVA